MISAELSCHYYYGDAYLEFSGNKKIVDLLTVLTHLITFKKYDKHQAKIECLEQLREQNKSKIDILEFEINSLKKKYKIIALHKEAYNKIKYYQNILKELYATNQIINRKISRLDDASWFSVDELKSKYKNLLATLEFSCKTSYHKKDINTSVQIYEYNGDEELLAIKVIAMTNKLQSKLDNEIEQIKQSIQQTLSSTTLSNEDILKL